MTNCLVTKYKGVIDNDELLKEGELRFNVPASDSNQNTFLQCKNGNITMKIIGEGSFVYDGSNRGKEFTLTPTNDHSPSILSPTGCKVSVSNKYNLTSLETNFKSFDDIQDVVSSFVKNITRLRVDKSSGDISYLKELPNLSYVCLTGNKIGGNISVFSSMSNISQVQLSDSACVGNLSAFSGKDISYLNLIRSKVSGDVSSLSSCNKLKTLYLGNTDNANVLKGDLSKMPAEFTFMSSSGINAFSWSADGRPSSSYIFGMEYVRVNDDIDNMLTNLAKCQTPPNANTIQKKLIVYTNKQRTSASDSAIETLQGKGYTISINVA